MGRQIAVAATAADEGSLLDFLRASADIRVFRSAAPSVEQLWVEEFDPFGPEDTQYFIWNADYAWKPKYRQSDGGGWFYVENALQGPVIEFDRTDIEGLLANLAVGAYGRVYWYGSNRQKGFAAWYEGIVRWVRRTGHNLWPGGPFGVWALPDAWRLWQARGAPEAEPGAAPDGGRKAGRRR